jgi:hypothetical protein
MDRSLASGTPSSPMSHNSDDEPSISDQVATRTNVSRLFGRLGGRRVNTAGASPSSGARETTPTDRWVADLMRDFPGLKQTHSGVERVVGRPVPALFMGQAVDWLVRLCRAGQLGTVRAFMARMDSDYPKFDGTFRRTFDVLFLGNLPGPGEPGAEIAQLVGPALRPEYERRHQGMAFGPWIATLLRDFPAIEPLYAEHLQDQGELLSTVLFSDITRWLVSLCEAGDLGAARSLVTRIGSDYPTLNSGARDVVHVSFLEDIPPRGSVGSEMAQWLGPTLDEEYRRWF